MHVRRLIVAWWDKLWMIVFRVIIKDVLVIVVSSRLSRSCREPMSRICLPFAPALKMFMLCVKMLNWGREFLKIKVYACISLVEAKYSDAYHKWTRKKLNVKYMAEPRKILSLKWIQEREKVWIGVLDFLTWGILRGIFGIVGGVQFGMLGIFGRCIRSLILLVLLLPEEELPLLLPNFGTRRLCSVMNASIFCFPPRT